MLNFAFFFPSHNDTKFQNHSNGKSVLLNVTHTKKSYESFSPFFDENERISLSRTKLKLARHSQKQKSLQQLRKKRVQDMSSATEGERDSVCVCERERECEEEGKENVCA